MNLIIETQHVILAQKILGINSTLQLFFFVALGLMIKPFLKVFTPPPLKSVFFLSSDVTVHNQIPSSHILLKLLETSMRRKLIKCLLNSNSEHLSLYRGV